MEDDIFVVCEDVLHFFCCVTSYFIAAVQGQFARYEEYMSVFWFA